MKTCKDCIHYDVCKKYNNVFERELSERYCVECQHFKNKANFVELPNVEIGQALFYIDRFTNTVESDIVSRLNWEETDLGVQTGIWSENNAFSEFFSDVGKTLFLTKEEAETKLKELNENEQQFRNGMSI